MITDLIYTTVVLGLTLGLFGGVIYALKYVQKRYQISSKLKLKENLFIDTKRRVCIVEYEGCEYMLVLGAQGEHVIDLNKGERHETYKRAA